MLHEVIFQMPWEFISQHIVSSAKSNTDALTQQKGKYRETQTGPFKAKWVSVFILTTTHSAPFRPQQGSKGRWGEIELWVRWHVQKPHHQPPEVIQSPDPLCVCVKCRSQVSNPSSPSTGCSHWIIQERLNALCSEQTGTKPHLDRISHHKLWSKSALVQHENVITCLELWRKCSSW